MAHRKGRSILTGTGIVLGVAILFGVLVANATTQKGVDNLIASFTGRADVVAGPIGSFDAKAPPGTIDRVHKLPDVQTVVGEYGFQTVLPEYPSKRDKTQPTSVAVGGIVPDEATKIRDYPFDDGRFPQAGRDEIAISRKLADSIGVKVGDRLKIRAKKATRAFAIVGIVNVKDVGGFNGGGGRAYMPMSVARKVQGDPAGTYDGAAIILKTGVDADQWIDAHRGEVPGIRLQNSDSLAAGFKQFLGVFGTFLAFFAAITLFVGAFLIYLTLSMAVIERTRIYGTLRALGATPKQVRRVVVTEAIALGVVSTIVGLGLGLVLALGLLQLIGKLFSLDIPGLEITPGALLTTVLVGVVVTLVSAMIPARRAGRLAPVVAMKGDYVRETRLSRAWIAGAIILVLATTGGVFGGRGVRGAMVIPILLGAVLLVPLLLRPVSQLLGRLTNRLARGVGDIAVLHLSKERSRSAYTLALVMVVMAMLFATGGLYLSVRSGIGEIVDRQFGADIFVQNQVPDDGTLAARLKKEPDVETISPLRFGIATGIDAKNESHEVFVRTVEPESYFAVSSFFWKDGNDADGKAALERGGSVVVTTEVARILGTSVGKDITLETSRGKHTFHVAATYIGAAGPPEMAMGIKDARTYLTASNPFAYALKVRSGVSPEGVAARIKHDLSAFQPRTQTSGEAKDEARGQIATYFQIVYAILLIAAIVGLLGLANTLAMSVLQRFREIGILRAIGVTRSQTWRMVLVESSTLGLTAFVLSMPLGALLTYLVVHGTSEGFGFTIPTLYPWLWVPFVALFALFIAAVAAIAPGRRASRLEVVSALQYE